MLLDSLNKDPVLYEQANQFIIKNKILIQLVMIGISKTGKEDINYRHTII